MDLILIAKEVCEIARKAGEAILEVYNREDLEVEKKGDESPLTIADRISNKIICDGLESLDIKFPIVSEENKQIPFETRKDYDYNWLVDPLDGTKEFIKRNGEFTVNIALIHQQRPVLGVVYIPVSDEMYWGVERAGSYIVENGSLSRLVINSFQLTDPGLKVVTSRSHMNDATKTFVEKLKDPETVARGSSLKFLAIATGQAHIYPRLGPTMEWDTGAAHIILQEAGGKIVVAETGEPLKYNKENLLNPYFIAYGKVIDPD